MADTATKTKKKSKMKRVVAVVLGLAIGWTVFSAATAKHVTSSAFCGEVVLASVFANSTDTSVSQTKDAEAKVAKDAQDYAVHGQYEQLANDAQQYWKDSQNNPLAEINQDLPALMSDCRSVT
jgi:hypothetical protein